MKSFIVVIKKKVLLTTTCTCRNLILFMNIDEGIAKPTLQRLSVGNQMCVIVCTIRILNDISILMDLKTNYITFVIHNTLPFACLMYITLTKYKYFLG